MRTPETDNLWGKGRNFGLTRRKFLTLFAVGGAGAVLAACNKAAALIPPATSTTSAVSPTSSIAPITSPSASSTVTSNRTVGLFVSGPGAWPGFTLFSPKKNTATYLIDNQGRQINKWAKSKYEPGQSCHLLPNGHLLRSAQSRGPISTGGGEGGRLEEYDWEGNLVWELDFSTDNYAQNYDFCALPNGNVLMVVVEKKTYDDAIAVGMDPAKMASDVKSKKYILPDAIYEVKPTLPKGGTAVWEWHVWDHIIQDFSSSRANYGNPGEHPERIDPNVTTIPVFWNHFNSIVYHPTLDQILVSARGHNEVWIIDHSTTTAEAASAKGGKSGKGGDLLYRWGNPAQYRAGTASDQKIFQQYDASWIEANCPGAGDIMVFNNSRGRNFSAVDQWTPPVDTKGNYTRVAGKAFGPSDYSWSYQANPPTSLYSGALGGAQRLPNGNTLICDGIHGTFLEVTAASETVWKYINPVVQNGTLGQTDAIPQDQAHPGELLNMVFRVTRYGLDYPAFKGKSITPGTTIEK